ncbi:MAG: hypothetical protein Q9222_002066 [Ikaeria aurantiellina]
MVSTNASTGFHMDNGPGNPIWEANFAKIRKVGDRTDEDWVIAEMETSDEDESAPQANGCQANGRKPHTGKGSLQCPIWEDIPAQLRIDMVHEASGEDTAVGPALRRLRLSPAQSVDMEEILRQYYKQRDLKEASEDDKIKRHQQLMNEILLSGYSRDYSSAEGFRAVLDAGLYSGLDGTYDAPVSCQDVDKARAYMEFCGLGSSFLDSHTSSSGSGGSEIKDPESSPLGTSPPGMTQASDEPAIGNSVAANGDTLLPPPPSPHTPTPNLLSATPKDRPSPALPPSLVPWPTTTPPTPSANGTRFLAPDTSASSPSAAAAAQIKKKRRIENSSNDGIHHSADESAPPANGARANGFGFGNGYSHVEDEREREDGRKRGKGTANGGVKKRKVGGTRKEKEQEEDEA